jgi:hypothetical protein
VSQTRIEDLPVLHDLFRSRYVAMDERHAEISKIINGDLDVTTPEEDRIEVVSANMIQTAIEDTAEAASIIPTIRVQPHNTSKAAKKTAHKMEHIALGYMETSNFEIRLPETFMRIAAFGFCPWVIWPDLGENVPVIELREPRGCYPEPGVRPGQRAKRVMFVREVFYSQLPLEHQVLLADHLDGTIRDGWRRNQKVTIVELFTDTEVLVGAILQSTDTQTSPTYDTANPTLSVPHVNRIPVELERIPNPTGVCQAFIGARPTADGEFRGQFDQVIGAQRAHSRLMGLLLEYADQSVYSDIWVKDVQGEVSFGGGSYIRLGPNGAIGRLQPAVSSLNVNSDLAMLEESIHLGGRWPKSRPGEISQSIASAKFLEASAGMMNTVVKTLHLVMRDMLSNALNLMFRVDQMLLPGEEKTTRGILANQEFIETYSTDDIDVRNRVKVEYGLGLGKDPSQSAVLHIQYHAQGFLSKQFVMESIEGLTDVNRELSRLDVEQFRDIALAKILQGTQDGTVSNEQILLLARKREEGVPLFDLFEEIIVEPERQMAEEPAPMDMLSGLGGMLPAAGEVIPPGGPGGEMPSEEPGVPPRPEPAQLLARLGSPAGPPGSSSILGTQVQ